MSAEKKISGTEVNKNKISPLWKEFFSNAINKEDVDGKWNIYLSTDRNEQEMVSLLSEDICSEYKEKAMETLLVSDLKELPFKVYSPYRNFLLTAKEWVPEVTTEQAIFIAEEIPIYINATKDRLGWVNNDRDIYQKKYNLTIYNSLIPMLLDKLPIKQANKLFKNFDINDPNVLSNFDENSSYHPLESLLCNESVDKRWKLKAVEKIHEVILQEKSGKIEPLDSWERAIDGYFYILDTLLRDFRNKENPLMNANFFKKEILFMMKAGDNGQIVNKENTETILNILSTNYEAANVFARRQILPNEKERFDGFNIFNNKDEKFAKKIIADFPNDVEMTKFLQDKIQTYQGRCRYYGDIESQNIKRSNINFPPITKQDK
jgi:hypothetical protein